MRFRSWGLAVAGLALSFTALQASIITACTTGNGGGGLNVSSCSVTQNPNTFTLNESFNHTSPGGAVFDLSAGGAQEYLVTKVITNDTAFTWLGFEVYIGGGTLGFQIPTTLFQFDLGITPGISGNGTGGASLASTNNLLSWTGLNIAPGESITLTFLAEVNATGHGQWQIQQQPLVTEAPEPATLVLSAAALVALGAVRRRRR
jgi:hypothetical protein